MRRIAGANCSTKGRKQQIERRKSKTEKEKALKNLQDSFQKVT